MQDVKPVRRPRTPVMQRYLVGGAVRDALLGRPVADRDWVLVGARPDELLRAGYLPVGRDFPVFLDPLTKEECALARTERKTAPGYHGFAFHADPDVTLEDDLERRDLTINAMAQADDGTLIDPHGGRRDLAARVLRHVSPAFAEDPVRILRLARFAARFADFTVAPDTLALMQQMVAAGEVDALVPERVWNELARGLMEAAPSRMFERLRDCGALARLLPEVTVDAEWLRVLDLAAAQQAPLTVRCSLLGVTRLRAPADCRELAVLLARERDAVHRSGALGAAGLVELFDRCDAWRRPARFAELLWAGECDALGRTDDPHAAYPPRARLQQALARATAVDSARVAADAAARGLRGPAIGAALQAARVAAVAAVAA